MACAALISNFGKPFGVVGASHVVNLLDPACPTVSVSPQVDETRDAEMATLLDEWRRNSSEKEPFK
jgi:hypothetical protein